MEIPDAVSDLDPGHRLFLVFKYAPLLGSVIAFENYNLFAGFVGESKGWLRTFREDVQLVRFPAHSEEHAAAWRIRHLVHVHGSYRARAAA